MKILLSLVLVISAAQVSMAQSIDPSSVPQGPAINEGNCLHCITPLTQPEVEFEKTECGAVLLED
jgi:hypothetical protein